MKTYQVIGCVAHSIAQRWETVGVFYADSEVERHAHNSELRNTTHAIADTFEQALPNFDRRAFLKKCFPQGCNDK